MSVKLLVFVWLGVHVDWATGKPKKKKSSATTTPTPVTILERPKAPRVGDHVKEDGAPGKYRSADSTMTTSPRVQEFDASMFANQGDSAKPGKKGKKSGAILDKQRNFTVVFPGVFTVAECEDLTRHAGPFEEAGYVGSGVQREDNRVTKVRTFYSHDEDLGWVAERLHSYATKANDMLWKYGPLRNLDYLQFASYEAAAEENDTDGHYDWHVDNPIEVGQNRGRVLSVSLQLSDPDDYEGGGLAVGARLVPRGVGDVVVFPSYMAHRVFPVSSGARLAIVTWVMGRTDGRGFREAALKAHREAMSDDEGWAKLPVSSRKLRIDISSGSKKKGSKADVRNEVPAGMRYMYGSHLLLQGLHKEAIIVLRDVVKDEPGRPGAANNLAIAEYYNGQQSAAISVLRMAVKERPFDGEVHSNLGKFCLAQGDLFCGISALGDAVALGHLNAIQLVAFLVTVFSLLFGCCFWIMRLPYRGFDDFDSVIIVGLKNRPELNGKKGVLVDYNKVTGRWTVDLPSDNPQEPSQSVSVKPSCLKRSYAEEEVFFPDEGPRTDLHSDRTKIAKEDMKDTESKSGSSSAHRRTNTKNTG
eukprot:gnl/MRDRNA2_/MRDRNA2_27137_c0_seq1.p1 gnl/MRDRNA2_/MRDRNA2_27137_c0~~gnl/MRDRNA2_/MRDRNA2_27137_c0_seq1.p1  ORF type:complete len:586 (+),score=103.67 gnl/MRDRNA2_/MRDRNA2_27137_c0_seq1:110-1867(+)